MTIISIVKGIMVGDGISGNFCYNVQGQWEKLRLA